MTDDELATLREYVAERDEARTRAAALETALRELYAAVDGLDPVLQQLRRLTREAGVTAGLEALYRAANAAYRLLGGPPP